MLNEIINDNAVEEVENSLVEENDTSVEDTTSTVDQKEIKDYLSSSLLRMLNQYHLMILVLKMKMHQK